MSATIGPGSVNAISEKVAVVGGTWLESRSVRLAGKFAGVVLVRIPDENLIPFEFALAKLAPSGPRVSIDRARRGRPERPAAPCHALEVVGKERPGIRARRDAGAHPSRRQYRGVHERPRRRAIHRCWRCFTQPPASTSLAALNSTDLRKAIEQLAAEIVVDLSVGDTRPADLWVPFSPCAPLEPLIARRAALHFLSVFYGRQWRSLANGSFRAFS